MIKFETADIQKLAKQAGVNKPVMSVRVVGDRIELHLLGGEVVPVASKASTPETEATTGQEETNVQPFSVQDILSDMTVARLKRIAAYLEMSCYSRLTKKQLITRLMQQFDDETLQEAVINSAFQ